LEYHNEAAKDNININKIEIDTYRYVVEKAVD